MDLEIAHCNAVAAIHGDEGVVRREESFGD